MEILYIIAGLVMLIAIVAVFGKSAVQQVVLAAYLLFGFVSCMGCIWFLWRMSPALSIAIGTSVGSLIVFMAIRDAKTKKELEFQREIRIQAAGDSIDQCSLVVRTLEARILSEENASKIVAYKAKLDIAYRNLDQAKQKMHDAVHWTP